MEGVLHGLEGIFEVLFIIAIGVALTKKGWFGSDMSAVFSKLVMKVSLPLYMLCQMEKDFTHDSLIRIAPDLILPFASIFLAYIVGRIAAKVLHIRRERQGVFVTCFFIANTIFIGLRSIWPSLVRRACLRSCSIIWPIRPCFGLSAFTISLMTARAGRGICPLFSAQTIKKVFSPPLMGFLIGLVFVLANIKLPDFLLTSFQYVGNMATPCHCWSSALKWPAFPFLISIGTATSSVL